MKKLLTVTCLAGLLSIPSVVFAEASWYGSIRVGVTNSGGDASVSNHVSRFGIAGSSEVSEGLTAAYRFEQGLDANIATQGGGRQSYVSLSGGFGSLTLGQIWSATYNSVGAITDLSTSYGDSETSGRHGNVISYAISNDTMSMQVDATLDGSKTGNNIDELEFGVSMNIADIGKIAFAHKRVEDDTTPIMVAKYKSTSEVLTKAVLDSGTKVIGGGVFDKNTLKIKSILLDSSKLDLDLTKIGIGGNVPLGVTGDVTNLTAANLELNAATKPAVICETFKFKDDGELDGTTTKRVNPEDCTGVDQVVKAETTQPDTTKPSTLKKVPSINTIVNQEIDTSGAVGNTVTYTHPTTKVEHPIKLGFKYVKIADDTKKCTGAAAVGDRKADPIDNTCKQQAYYYYLDADDEEVDVTDNAEKDAVSTGTVNLPSTNLNVVKNEVDGKVITGEVTLQEGSGELEGKPSMTPQEFETKTEVTTNPVIETTTTKELPVATPNTVPGSTSNFVAGQVTLGGVIGYLGYKEVKTNGIDATASTTFAGIRGSLGDTGISYFTQLRNQETASPWMFGLSKSLGGGASVGFEYADDDLPTAKSKAAAWLRVDF